jgi:hypothetical protein
MISIVTSFMVLYHFEYQQSRSLLGSKSTFISLKGFLVVFFFVLSPIFGIPFPTYIIGCCCADRCSVILPRIFIRHHNISLELRSYIICMINLSGSNNYNLRYSRIDKKQLKNGGQCRANLMYGMIYSLRGWVSSTIFCPNQLVRIC